MIKYSPVGDTGSPINECYYFQRQLIDKTEKLVFKLINCNERLVFAESCTGGLLSALFTEIAGVSSVFCGSLVVYSDKSKIDFLGVERQIIEQFGSVSEECAKAMAIGALSKVNATLSLAITGIAGPGGATLQKPVGLVWLAAANAKGLHTHKLLLSKHSRQAIRLKAVAEAVTLIEKIHSL